MIETRRGSYPALTADQLAGVLLELVERGKTSGRPGVDHELAAVLADGLDRYARASLYCTATARLGRPIGPDPHRYCPWCDSEYGEAGFGEHLQSAHRSMVDAG